MLKSSHILLSIFISLTISTVANSQDKCKFSSITFNANLEEFLGTLSPDWKYSYSQNNTAKLAYKDCKETNKNNGFEKQKYITGCHFKSKNDLTFRSMSIFSKKNTTERLDLLFKRNQTHKSIYAKLISNYGEPTRSGKYKEEAFQHNLREWNNGSCRLIYDFGGIENNRPIYLIIEKLPSYSGGFNAGSVNLYFLR